MHGCLRVTEILDQILTDILQDRPGIKGKNDLISVALTCREFLEIALDISWKTQSSLVPLIKTLPQRCWRDGPSYLRLLDNPPAFDRPFKLLVSKLTIEEQERFTFYSKRIRRLEYLPYAWHAVPTDHCPYDMRILRTIWATRTDKERPLFPNLQSLEFAVINHAEACLDIFLETKHVSLALYFPNDNTTTLFPIIEKHALNMEELDLGDFQDVRRFTGHDAALSDLVCKMTDLRALSCGPRSLTTKAILHLSSLPHLRKLRVPHNSQEILQGLGRQTFNSPFPELQELVIRETELPSFVFLIKQIRPTQIRDLVIQLCHVPHSQEIREAFVALAEGNSKLGDVHRIVFKDVPHSETALYGQPRRRDLYALDTTILVNGSILDPLLSFTNLTVLELGIRCKFELGDTQIKAMADAWPGLKRLHLGSFLGWHLPSSITYDGFLHLLWKCPELHYLALSFDASSHVPTPILGRHVNKNIPYLYVGDSRIGTNNPDSIGKFLASVLPKCTGIGGEWMMRPSNESGNWSEWARVVKALKKYQMSEEVSQKKFAVKALPR